MKSEHYFQLSLPAKIPFNEAVLTEPERERVADFIYKAAVESHRVVSLYNLTNPSVTGRDAFEGLYSVGYRLATAAEVGGCKQTATIVYTFESKEF